MFTLDMTISSRQIASPSHADSGGMRLALQVVRQMTGMTTSRTKLSLVPLLSCALLLECLFGGVKMCLRLLEVAMKTVDLRRAVTLQCLHTGRPELTLRDGLAASASAADLPASRIWKYSDLRSRKMAPSTRSSPSESLPANTGATSYRHNL